MDVIAKYVPNIKNLQMRGERVCEEVLTEFMQNYDQIAEESDSLFISKYFMSALLGFCADINFENYQLLEQFFGFFVSKQSGIWDIWSVYEFCEKRWISMETCLGIRFKRLREEPKLGLKYIIEMTHKLNIEFTDPTDPSVTFRFIDYPRFDAIQSKSDLWRNLHRPVIDCTLLPERPDILRQLLQFGAVFPTADHQHILHRIKHFNDITTSTVIKKLFWIKLAITDLPHRTQMRKELTVIGNELITSVIESTGTSQAIGIYRRIETVLTLKQLTIYRIRCCLRSNNKLPQGIYDLPIDRISAEYVNLERIQ